ncbi:MAG TPA: Gfo/Idh/MocA family oxidoreductase [Candidatus Dormibacteraeota bacterium]|jgi:predicted dehydrogenase
MIGLRVALIGYGLAGRMFHGPLLRATPRLRVAAIVVRDRQRRQRAAADFPQARLLASADELWAHRDDFDLVVVATPPDSHTALAEAAIDARLALVVEKPLATNADGARRLIERAVAAHVLLVPFHNRRWDSDQLTLRGLIANGELGEIYRYESRFERWRPSPDPNAWRETLAADDGGGVLLDLGVHLVDQALSLFGPITGVVGEVEARRGGANDDVFIALHHASGTRSHLWASAVTAAPGPRLRVLGSRGAYVVEHLDGQEAALREGADPAQADFGAEPPDRWGRLVRGEESQTVPSQPGRWRDFYPAVEQAIRTGEAPPVRASDALAALEVLDAARISPSASTPGGRT